MGLLADLGKGLFAVGIVVFFIPIGGRAGDPILHWFISNPSLQARVAVLLLGCLTAATGLAVLNRTGDRRE